MYERFTDRARKVMQLANQEAQRFNHEYIGTEHILLGLARGGTGTGAIVLKNLGIDLRKIRLEVEKIIQSGPDMVVMGQLPQTVRAKKVIEFAIEESRSFGHNYVGSEHVLLGVIREEEGVGSMVLRRLGLSLEILRAEVLKFLGSPAPHSPRGEEVDLSELPPETQDIAGHFNAILEQSQAMKEVAIAASDFEKAALLRDQMVKLDKIKDWFISYGDGHGPQTIPSNPT